MTFLFFIDRTFNGLHDNTINSKTEQNTINKQKRSSPKWEEPHVITGYVRIYICTARCAELANITATTGRISGTVIHSRPLLCHSVEKQEHKVDDMR